MDLPFADLEVPDGSERLYPAPGPSTEGEQENAPDLTGRGHSVLLSARPGSRAIYAGLRSQAKLGGEPTTLSLGM
jgi:hypothetical protein